MVKHTLSLATNYKHILSIKQNLDNGEAQYYRSYCGILARPKEKLAEEPTGRLKVDWLENDVAVVTYKTANQTIQQLDRKSTRLNSSHVAISYAVFCLKKKS